MNEPAPIPPFQRYFFILGGALILLGFAGGGEGVVSYGASSLIMFVGFMVCGFAVPVQILAEVITEHASDGQSRGRHSSGATESVLEEDLKRLLERSGFPEPLTQYWVKTGGWLSSKRWHRLDFAYPDLRLAVEADGAEFHDPQSDRERDLRLATKGWVTVRFSWGDVHSRPDGVVETLVRHGLPIERGNEPISDFDDRYRSDEPISDLDDRYRGDEPIPALDDEYRGDDLPF